MSPTFQNKTFRGLSILSVMSCMLLAPITQSSSALLISEYSRELLRTSTTDESIKRLLKEEKYYEALNEVKAKIAEMPSNPDLYVMAGAIYKKMGMLPQAESQFLKAVRVEPGSIKANAHLATLAQSSNNLDMSRKYLLDTIKHHPDHLATLLLLGSVESRLERNDEAEKWLKRAVESHPDHVQAKLFLARFYLDSQPEKTFEILMPLLAHKDQSPEIGRTAALAKIMLGQTAAAIRILKSVVAESPGHAPSQFTLARAYIIDGDTKNAQSNLEEILKYKVGHNEAKLALSRVMIDNKDFSRVFPLLNDLLSERPDNAVYIHLAIGLAVLGRELPHYPTRDAMLGLVNRYMKQGEEKLAEKLLHQWLSRFQEDTGSRIYLHELYTRGNKAAAAKANLIQIIKVDPDHWYARNELSWLLYKEGDYKTSLIHSRRAYSQVPGKAAVGDTLGVVLIAEGMFQEAIAVLSKAYSQQPGADIGFHLAQAQAGFGDGLGAAETLTSLLSSNRDFKDRQSAVELLGRIRREKLGE